MKICRDAVQLYVSWKGSSWIFLVCHTLLALVDGWCVSWPFETCKCGTQNNQSSCRSLRGFFEHACLETNIGLWFLLGARNGNLINSSCVHLRNKGCVYQLLAAFGENCPLPLPKQALGVLLVLYNFFINLSQCCFVVFCFCCAGGKNPRSCCWR